MEPKAAAEAMNLEAEQYGSADAEDAHVPMDLNRGRTTVDEIAVEQQPEIMKPQDSDETSDDELHRKASEGGPVTVELQHEAMNPDLPQKAIDPADSQLGEYVCLAFNAVRLEEKGEQARIDTNNWVDARSDSGAMPGRGSPLTLGGDTEKNYCHVKIEHDGKLRTYTMRAPQLMWAPAKLSRLVVQPGSSAQTPTPTLFELLQSRVRKVKSELQEAEEKAKQLQDSTLATEQETAAKAVDDISLLKEKLALFNLAMLEAYTKDMDFVMEYPRWLPRYNKATREYFNVRSTTAPIEVIDIEKLLNSD